jgi:16S rRNA (cytosine1402-N4)-methyltransferase
MPDFHVPVMADKVVELFSPLEGKTIVDCTLGGGGHAEKLSNVPPEAGRLSIVGIDRDEEALRAAEIRLSGYQDIRFVHDNFSNIAKIIDRPVDGFLFDLGVSSHQIDEASRGFSFREDAPLDMRMDKRTAAGAADLVNSLSPEELTRIFSEYGEERFSKRISNAICVKRKACDVKTTFELKEIVEKAIPTWKKRESTARIFQALRIAVNSELESLKKALEGSRGLLKSGGRVIVISYHSLEDRIVKTFFREEAKNGILKIITKKPVIADEKEINENPRAKSAKLRCAEKI